MPVSKKRRRAKSNPRSPKGSSTRVTLPDRRAMEGFMAAIGGRQAYDAIAKAQQVMYDAWDQTDSRARTALAHKALTISPLCADAYVLLAEEEAKSVDEALEYYRKGVEMAEQALGTKRFKEYLYAHGEINVAMSHYQDMLTLNPNDNQGIRYVLAQCLMRKGDTATLKKLLKQYDEDAGALWVYTKALIAFRENELSDKGGEELVKRACKANSHIPAVLAGTKKAKPSRNGYVTMGGEDEAAHYAEEWGFDWLTTPGAIDWLTKIVAEMASSHTERRSVH